METQLLFWANIMEKYRDECNGEPVDSQYQFILVDWLWWLICIKLLKQEVGYLGNKQGLTFVTKIQISINFPKKKIPTVFPFNSTQSSSGNLLNQVFSFLPQQLRATCTSCTVAIHFDIFTFTYGCFPSLLREKKQNKPQLVQI